VIDCLVIDGYEKNKTKYYKPHEKEKCGIELKRDDGNSYFSTLGTKLSVGYGCQIYERDVEIVYWEMFFSGNKP
ncbi:hypothetical protein AVEN_55380-1, partial [Araneus ventricosus]